MGYGLLDAYAAVLKAKPCTTPSPLVNTNQTVNCDYVYLNNILVTSGAKLTVNAKKRFEITGPFEVQLGSQLEINNK